MLRCLVLIFYILIALPLRVNAEVRSRIDSLDQLLENASEEERVEIFCSLSELYWQISFDTSLLMAIHADNIATSLKDPSLKANSLYMIGNAHYLLGNYPKSVDYYFQALEIREELGDSSYLGSIYNNIGAVYLLMEDEHSALDYFKRAGRFFRVLGDKNQLFANLNNIGAVYMDQEILDTAFQYFSQAFEIAKQNGNEINQSIALTNMGEATLSMGLLSLSEEYQLQAYEISSKLGDMAMIATIRLNLGKLYLKRKDFDRALESFQESLVIAKEINSLQVIQENYLSLSEHYSLLGEDKQALRLYKMYASVRDSILSREIVMQVKELELKFNARTLQQEIELLTLDNEVKSLRQARLTVGIIALIILVLALGLMVLLYYQKNKLKKETTRILEEKNQELEKTNKKLQESEKNLKELNSTKDKFFSIIGHDLRNPLNALLGFSELISGNSNDYSPEEIQKYSKIINEAAKNIHMLIENLLEWSRSQSGNIEFNPRKAELYPILEEILKIFRIQAEKKALLIEMKSSSDLKVFADSNLLSTILRNLVNNAVKFTPKKGRVDILAEQTGDGVTLTITDTGIGMTEEQVGKLFTLAHGPSTPGTAEEKGTGLGLILCKEFIDMHNGRIEVESEPGKGSTFRLFLPDK